MKDHLDRIEVWRILRQVAQARADGRNRLLNADDLVGRKVVDHDNISALERRSQALLKVGEKDFSIHGSVDQHRRDYSGMTQTRNERDGFPVPEGHMSDQALPACTAAVWPYHVGADGGLIEKHQSGGIEEPLLTNPATPCARHVGSLLFGGAQAFF